MPCRRLAFDESVMERAGGREHAGGIRAGPKSELRAGLSQFFLMCQGKKVEAMSDARAATAQARRQPFSPGHFPVNHAKMAGMAEEDFDIESLAAYLHLSPTQVGKLAERGKLPARRVSGDWRFSRAEVNLWLEERIGLSAEEELLRVEGVLQSLATEAGAEQASVAAQLPPEAIEIPLAARTRNSAIHSMVELAARTGWLWDPAKMAEAVGAREDMHPTALESGVALLHPRRPMPSILGQAFLAFGRTERGIPFGGSRGVLTDAFFLICSIDDRGHLQTLARLSRLIAAPGFLVQLREASDPRATREVIEQFEQALAT